jgi:hypothetical protein
MLRWADAPSHDHKAIAAHGLRVGLHVPRQQRNGGDGGLAQRIGDETDGYDKARSDAGRNQSWRGHN